VERVAGLYILVFPDDVYFVADATVNPDPGPRELAEIAILSGDFAARFGVDPRIAMISFSDFGSASHPAARKVSEAVALVKEERPDLTVDGEMQADTALDAETLGETYPFSALQERANVLILPNLDAANAAYKLLNRLADATAIGPVLLGMDRPVHILQRGAGVSEIANLAAIAAVDAAGRARGGGSGD
jgi:malate dehydrogenase (oxaloacetate-decarboxylating)(NADP+)